MNTLEQRFQLVSKLDAVKLKDLPRSELRALIQTTANFLWNLCACRSCGGHTNTFTIKLPCQFCTVCGEHKNSPEIEA